MDELTQKEICLYGMGVYGIRMFFFLRDRDIKVKCFADRSLDANGRSFMNIHCISYDEVSTYSIDTTCLVVCLKNPNGVIREFIEKGFRNVYSSEEFKEMLLDLPAKEPKKWSEESFVIKEKKIIEAGYVKSCLI